MNDGDVGPCGDRTCSVYLKEIERESTHEAAQYQPYKDSNETADVKRDTLRVFPYKSATSQILVFSVGICRSNPEKSCSVQLYLYSTNSYHESLEGALMN